MGLFGSFSGSPFHGVHGLYITRDWDHCWHTVYSNEWLGFHVFEAGKKEKAMWHIRFLDASTHLYKRVCPSVRPSVRRSVGRSVRPWCVFFKSRKLANLTNLTNLNLQI